MQRKWKRRWQRLTKAILPPVAAGLLFLSSYSPVLANPAGGTVVSGSANIASSGSTMTVNQTTNKAVINWQSFSIGSGETVNFVQPNASSVALNRVIGSDASSIYGSLNANGKVYLINPNGILFAPGSSVNVGGLVASTLNISDSDFVSGNYTLQKDGSAGSVVNQGTITAANEAVLIGPKVANDGVIAAKVTGLAAGNTVSLDFTGDNLLNVTVDTGAAGGSATNTGTITATGGLVVMSAGTKDALLNTVVNNNGIIRAQNVTNAGGVIRLEGNTGTNSGTLDASGKAAGQTGGTVKVLGDTITLTNGSSIDVSGDAGGGTALIGGAYQGGGSEYAATNTTVQTGATINADAITSGNGGTVVVWANDTTNFAGTITAKGGSVSGNGGSVETSGHTLKIGGEVNAGATNGKNGSWLLDPEDLTVDLAAASTISSSLNNNTDVTLQTTSTTASGTGTVSSGNGDITINAPIVWDTGTGNLKLSAYNNINLNSSITAANGGLTLIANTSGSGNGTTTGIITPAAGSSINVGTFTLQSGSWREVSNSLSSFSAKDFRISDGGIFLRALDGNGTSASPYQIADVYGLQGIGSSSDMRSKSYTLANSIDASGTQYWNYDSSTSAYLGFVPIGNSNVYFTGSFDGGGYTITGLTINRRSTNGVGMFGDSSGTIRNVGLVGGSITGSNYVGGLVGYNDGGTITNNYSTGAVNSTGSGVGGLVGLNSGSIENSYSTGKVTGNFVGGLVGHNDGGTITNSYSTGEVTATGSYVGGLVGFNFNGSIENSYSTGKVTGSIVGGLVGYNFSGTITNSYWDVDTSGKTTGIGGGINSGVTGLSSKGTSGYNSAFDQSSYSGFDFTTTWYMVDGQTRPFLRSEYSTTVTNAHQLQLMAMNLTASCTLANDIDMSEQANESGMWRTSTTAASDGSYGFVPIGTYDSAFTGNFDGSGHTITGLIINRSGTDNVGLFGYFSTGTISSVGLVGGSVAGHYNVGGLVGYNAGSIENSYSTGEVTGSAAVGGLVGGNVGSIENSYSTGEVNGSSFVGGLVGANSGSIKNSYSTGEVTGSDSVGGLVGANYSGTITNSYSTGKVGGTNSNCVGGLVGGNVGSIENSYSTGEVNGSDSVGGLVGANSGSIENSYSTGEVTGTGTASFVGGLVGYNFGTVTNCYWDVDTSGKTNGIGEGTDSGATGLTTAQMKQASSYTNWGNDIATTGGSSSVWRIYDGYSYPLLRSFLTAVTVTATPAGKTYDGTAASGSNLAYTLSDPGASLSVGSGGLSYTTGSKNAGDYSTADGTLIFSGLYSGQQGYDISYAGTTLTINKASLTVTANNVTKTYDGTTTVTGGSTAATGGTQLYGGDTISGGTYAFADKNAGSNKTVTVSGVTVNDGNNGNNYTVSYVDNTTSTIDQAELTLAASTDTKTYDGGKTSAGTVAYSGLQGSDTLSNLTQEYDSKNAGSRTLSVTGYAINDGNGGNNYHVNLQTAAGTINQRDITVSAVADTKTYDGTVASGLTPTANWLAAGDTLSGVQQYSDKNAGTAKTLTVISYTVNDGNNGGNYNVTAVNSNTAGVINRAALTVSANNATKTTGQPNPVFTASYSGLGTGDTPASLTGSLAFDTAATAASGPGSYAITLIGTLSSPNYTISYVNGILTVSGRPTNPAYDGAVIHADQMAAGLLGPLKPYGQPYGLGGASGYQASGSGSAAPLTIVGTGINTGGYLMMSDTEQ